MSQPLDEHDLRRMLVSDEDVINESFVGVYAALCNIGPVFHFTTLNMLCRAPHSVNAECRRKRGPVSDVVRIQVGEHRGARLKRCVELPQKLR